MARDGEVMELARGGYLNTPSTWKVRALPRFTEAGDVVYVNKPLPCGASTGSDLGR